MFAALIILALHIPSVHTAMGGAAARAPTRAPGYPIEEGAYSGFLPGLEYRPWRHGDLFGGEQLPMTYGRRFVAAVPNSEYVLGYVESEEDKPAPAYLWDELFVAFKPEADHVKASLLSIVGYVESQEVSHFLAHMLKLPAKERDTVVYISIVYVVSNERRKGIGEMMLRKALEDIRIKWPRVTEAYLRVNPYNEGALRLYKRLNFTFVTEKDGNYYLFYKFPPRDVVGTSTAAV
ncbi:hypothetical protein FOZ61_003530 [Perkinsus olseni]|uniref:N-acetyltransferase domain-containing protein n=1 Tax=Perkinsus olseni TaxID=32597 RepID=A0A7J6MDC8_PEROL|nr:hypothetical protein FOZ61_003530 [Perkinsus olseni]